MIQKNSNFTTYLRDGFHCYVSKTLRKELYITDGFLMKEPRVKIKVIKRNYYKTYVTIDFSRKLLRFKKSGMGRESDFKVDKDVDFS